MFSTTTKNHYQEDVKKNPDGISSPKETFPRNEHLLFIVIISPADKMCRARVIDPGKTIQEPQCIFKFPIQLFVFCI